MKKPKKLPKERNRLAYEIVRISTEESDEPEKAELPPTRSAISEYLAQIGRKGGLKGGKARAAKLTKKQRQEIAKTAAMARWKKTES